MVGQGDGGLIQVEGLAQLFIDFFLNLRFLLFVCLVQLSRQQLALLQGGVRLLDCLAERFRWLFLGGFDLAPQFDQQLPGPALPLTAGLLDQCFRQFGGFFPFRLALGIVRGGVRLGLPGDRFEIEHRLALG